MCPENTVYALASGILYKEIRGALLKIVLLPGLDGTGKLFDAFISFLPPELNPVVCTYPGDESLSYRELHDVAWECCPSNEPYLVLGESFSGPIAIEIGAKRPPMLKGMILVNTFRE